MLTGLQRFGWAPVEENGYLIALKREGASVSLEPGGQLELSGAPLEHVHQTCREVSQHLREVKEVADEMGAGFLSLGFRPDTKLDDVPTENSTGINHTARVSGSTLMQTARECCHLHLSKALGLSNM